MAAPSSINIAVGSTNPVKISSCKLAFARCFPDTEIVTHGVSAASGVAEQPMGDVETRTGAFNRALNAAAAYLASTGSPATYAVGLEGGCDDTDVVLPRSDAPSALPTRVMSCFAWMAVLHVPSGRWGIARTGSFTVPEAVALLVREGVELGVADDRVFGRTNSKQSDGAVGLLTHGVIDRTAYYEHALVLALVPHTNEALYPV